MVSNAVGMFQKPRSLYAVFKYIEVFIGEQGQTAESVGTLPINKQQDNRMDDDGDRTGAHIQLRFHEKT